MAELAYEYAFLRGEHYELAGSVGIHELTFKLQLTAVGQNVNQQLSGRADVNGPLPVIGLHYVWEFYPRWSLDAMFQFFALKFQQYDGNLQDYNATVFYMPWKNFGFGLGWNQFRTSVNNSSIVPQRWFRVTSSCRCHQTRSIGLVCGAYAGR